VTPSGLRMCSAPGARFPELLGYPLTGNRQFDILQSRPLAGTECNSIS
jgi:hypothetical protein